MEKDYITINTTRGKRRAELVSRFEIDNLGKYVIYKLNGEFYGAKYEINGEDTILIPDLTRKEQEAINDVFMQLEVE